LCTDGAANRARSQWSAWVLHVSSPWEDALGLDDSARFGVHCIGGIIGALGTAFGDIRRSAAPAIMETTHGKIAAYDSLRMMISQLGVCTHVVGRAIGSRPITRFVDPHVGLARPMFETEREGLHNRAHERAYNM